MSDPFLFPELETDEAAINAFIARENARVAEAFEDAQFREDAARVKAIMQDDNHLRSVRRRSTWVYNFLRNEAHPRGLWRRLPEGAPLSQDAPWEPVFDLDAFCAETGEDWHWRGAEVAFFDGEKILIALSWQGSDQTRYLEWDPVAQTPQSGGFDTGPERSSAAWLDANTLLFTTSANGGATRSGWQGRVTLLSRGMDPSNAPRVFEVDHEDLLAYATAFAAPDGTTWTATMRIRVIGDVETTLHPNGIGGPKIELTCPKNTHANFSTTHYAYVAADEGPDPAGALVLQNLDGTNKRLLFSPRPYASVDQGMLNLGHRHMLWLERDRTVPSLRVLDLEDPQAEPVTVPLPVEAQSAWLYAHDALIPFDGPMQIITTGFLSPPVTWVFDLENGIEGITFEKLTEEPHVFDAEGMSVHLHEASSADGTKIPYHIVLPTNVDGPVPVLQYAYGGFGASMAPSYAAVEGPLWLERGGAYVLAYIRGGGEFGTDWHLAAKGRNRHRAFEDFAAVAADLTRRGYSTPAQIGCHGGSNGGLLCSVMLTRYPEHFGAIWPSVAVTDMLRFHLFPAGAGWIDEYGDPDDPDDAAALLAYSPMHQVTRHDARPYPPAFVATNDSDDRVDPSHSRRFAAALLAAGQPTYFHSASGGHGGGGSTDQIAEERARGIAFLRKILGLG